MSEGNGQQPSGSERLDRIERALELIMDDHILFREEHKLLLSAQVQMHGGMEELREGFKELREGYKDLRDGIKELRDGLDSLRGDVSLLVTEFRRFGGNVESMRADFDQRLKRLGG